MLPTVLRTAKHENARKVIVSESTIVIVLGDMRKSKRSDKSKPPKAVPIRRASEAARPRPQQDARCSRSAGAKVAPTPSKSPMSARKRRSHIRRLANTENNKKEKREETCPGATLQGWGSCADAVAADTDVEMCAVVAEQTATKWPLPTSVSVVGPDTQEGRTPPSRPRPAPSSELAGKRRLLGGGCAQLD